MKNRQKILVIFIFLIPLILLVALGQSMASAASLEPSLLESANGSLVDSLRHNLRAAAPEAEADLGIEKVGSPNTLFPGQSLTYTLTISNSGAISATNVVVTDTLPVSLTVDNVTTSQGGPCVENSVLECPLGDIEVGATAKITIETTVVPDYSGLLTNVAEVGSDTPELAVDNNTFTETTTVEPIVDLTIEKSDDPDPVHAGASLTYNLLVSNTSTFFPAEDVVVTDTLPAEVSFNSVSASQGSCVGANTVTCTLGTIPADSSSAITIEVTVNSGASGSINNEAEVDSTTADSNPDNNSTQEPTDLTQLVDLAVGKTAIPDPAVAGGLLSYNIVINNNGPSDASGVLLADTLPFSTTFQSASVVQAATVVHIIDTSKFDPPSPDPAGLAYNPDTENLLMSDSEVDELPIYTDENVWELKTDGTQILVDTFEPYTHEPTGLAYDPVNEIIFVSDDVEDEIFMFDTGYNFLSSFDTSSFSHFGPEGVAYNTDNGHLYTVDGSTNNVYDISPGDNGIFDGVPPDGDDEYTFFNVFVLGIRDPEALAYNSESQTLFVGDRRTPTIIETTTDGALLRRFDLIPTDIRISGLTVAPSSANPSVLSLYAADRGVDNDDDPTENDGKVYEIAIPSPSGPSGPCVENSAIECDLGTLLAGDVAVVTIVVQVDLNAPSPLTNQVAVSTTSPEDETDNNLDIIQTPVVTRADLSILKDDDPDPVTAGESLTYTLTISNSGPSNALGVVVTDTIPAGTVVSSATASQGTGCITTSIVECPLGDMPVSTQATITITVGVSPSVQLSITNEAEVSSLTVDEILGNNFITETTTVTTSADLAIAKIADPVVATAGTNLTYTVVITNNGPSDAQGVVVTDTLPAGVTLVSAIASQGSPCGTGTTPDCALGAIAASSQATVTLVVNIDSGTSDVLTNTVDVVSTTPDPFPENNQAQTETAVLAVADLSLIKSDDPDPVVAGNNLTYTLTISNAGPSDAAGVVVTDTLPAGTQFVNAMGNLLSGCTTNGDVVCQMAPLTAGQMTTVTMIVGLDSSLPGLPITNTAEISSAATDPDENNNSDTITTTVQTLADIAITKLADPDPIAAGEPITYTITVQDLGPSDAAGVVVTDTLPGEVSFVSVDSSQGICSEGAIVECDLGVVSVNNSAVITVVGQLAADSLNMITNTAVVTTTTQDDFLDNNAVTVETIIAPQADLSIVKADEPDPVTAGTNLTYTLTISNNGPSDALGVVVTDTLPSGVTLISTNPSQGDPNCSDGAAPVCQLGTITSGSQATVTITVQVDPGVNAPLQNTAEVTSETADPSPENNFAQSETSVQSIADLSLVKVDDPDPVMAGSNLTYLLTISNAGPSDAAGVLVTDTVPLIGQLISAEAEQGDDCTYSGVVNCELGIVTVGQTTYVTVVVGIDSTLPGQLISNTAAVSSSAIDPNDDNNVEMITTTVQTAADLSISKVADPDPVIAGEFMTYTLTVENFGPSFATGIIVTDTLANEVTFVSVDTTLGSCSEGAIVECDIGSLTVSSSAVITIVVDVDTAAVGIVENIAQVQGDQQDLVPENNEITLVTSVNRVGTLPLIKLDDPDPVVAGKNLTYTLHISSTGPSDATGVVLTDTLPSEVTFTAVSTNRGTCDENVGVVVCELGDMPVGTDATVEIQVDVAADTLGQINNEAVVMADGATPTMASQNTTVQALADLIIDSFAEPDPVYPGENVTFTLSITNSGPSLADGVFVNNTLPTGVTFVSSPDCAPSVSVITCDLGDFAPGDSVETYLVVLVNTTTPGFISNVANVFSSTPDPIPGNNSSTASTEVLKKEYFNYLPIIVK